MERWQGRVALVTGGSQGIGKSVVLALLKYEINVVTCGRNLEKFKEVEEAAKALPGQLVTIQCDVGNSPNLEGLFAKVKTLFGGVDIMVNNAGIANDAGTILAGIYADWQEMINVNLLAVAVGCREAVRSMRERGVDDGCIFIINSLSGHRLTTSRDNFYGVTKHAVTALHEGVRRELREANSHIRVTSISPGTVLTPFHESARARDLRNQTKAPETNEFGFQALEAEDITDALLYALSTPTHIMVHDILIRSTEQRL